MHQCYVKWIPMLVLMMMISITFLEFMPCDQCYWAKMRVMVAAIIHCSGKNCWVDTDDNKCKLSRESLVCQNIVVRISMSPSA